MTQLARQVFTFAEYLTLEEDSGIKHEFLDGVVYAMSGGSPAHAAIAANLIRLLGAALEGRRCRVFTADLRVRVRETGLGTYPDVSVVCDQLEMDPDDPKGHTVVNPALVCEVLSPSTEGYDRGEKLAHYKRVPSLREVVLVAHDDRRVEVWRRAGDRWLQLGFGAGERVTLESLGCAIAVDEIYRDPLAG